VSGTLAGAAAGSVTGNSILSLSVTLQIIVDATGNNTGSLVRSTTPAMRALFPITKKQATLPSTTTFTFETENAKWNWPWMKLGVSASASSF
jgi:hypothetical protein